MLRTRPSRSIIDLLSIITTNSKRCLRPDGKSLAHRCLQCQSLSSQTVETGIRNVLISYPIKNHQNGNFGTTFTVQLCCNQTIRNFYTSQPLKIEEKRSCWKCGADTNPKEDLFFCKCGIVQRQAKSISHYDMMRLETSFDVNISLMSQRFKDTQKLLHPDKFSTKSKEEQECAAEQSSLLNKAYYTLLKPMSRAIYLLEQQGVTISETDSVTDPEFLMSMMEDFEKIAEATSSKDVQLLEEENDRKVQKAIKDLSVAFNNNDFALAKEHAIRLRYYTTIDERIKEAKIRFIGEN